MVKLITSQSYIDDDIVNNKIANNDYDVFLSPVFIVNGMEYQVVMDGHHSYNAAMIAGVEPNYITQSITDNDKVALLDEDIDLFLEACYIDSDWHDIKTGYSAF